MAALALCNWTAKPQPHAQIGVAAFDELYKYWLSIYTESKGSTSQRVRTCWSPAGALLVVQSCTPGLWLPSVLMLAVNKANAMNVRLSCATSTATLLASAPWLQFGRHFFPRLKTDSFHGCLKCK